MEKSKKRAKILLCISIALMLVSMIVASSIQTDGGKVTMKELFVETDDGFGQSSYLFIPSTATPDNPAPAIVTSHGLFNNKEMQDANFVELARRGFVVLAIDQANHGDSDLAGTNGIATPYNNGVYEGAVILSRLPYVDKDRIGITGHSMGGMSCNVAVAADVAKGTNLISAVLLNSADATYTDGPPPAPGAPATGNFTNVYGSRSVGIISGVYDEFFFGSADANGIPQAAPYYMESANAQSFMNFGKDPAAGLEKRDADTAYHETIDGKDVVRIIYRPAIIHPWSHFSTLSTNDTIDFFTQTLGAPNPIDASNQVWTVKEAFNFVGLIGFALFLISFAVLMLFTQFFSSLRAKEVVQPLQAEKGGKLWFWGSLIAVALFSILAYLPVTNPLGMGTSQQSETIAITTWAAVCGVFVILVMALFYNLYAKKHGVTLENRGIKISLSGLGKTVLLAVIVAGVSYAWVFFADYFFKTDFRLWTLAFKAFGPKLLITSLFPYLPLLLVFFIPASMATNCFNYNQVGGKRSWVNTLIVSLFAGAPAIIMLVIQYATYFSANHMAWAASAAGVSCMFIVWLFPLVVVLPVAAAISRWIYKVTRNPYLPGIINAIIVVIFACTNTRTMF
jgi:pimeloyl-ACP methyl ester carboxylesterase